MGMMEDLRSAVLDVVGVESVTIRQHGTFAFALFVEGGDDHEIAEVIWQHKPAGIETLGELSFEVMGAAGRCNTIRFTRGLPPYQCSFGGEEYEARTAAAMRAKLHGLGLPCQVRGRGARGNPYPYDVVAIGVAGMGGKRWVTLAHREDPPPSFELGTGEHAKALEHLAKTAELSIGYSDEQRPIDSSHASMATDGRITMHPHRAQTPRDRVRCRAEAAAVSLERAVGLFDPTAFEQPVTRGALYAAAAGGEPIGEVFAKPSEPDYTVMRSKPWGEPLFTDSPGRIVIGSDPAFPGSEQLVVKIERPRVFTWMDERPRMHTKEWAKLRDHVLRDIRENGMPLMPITVDPDGTERPTLACRSGGVSAWASKTVDEILADVRTLINDVVDSIGATQQGCSPDRVGMLIHERLEDHLRRSDVVMQQHRNPHIFSYSLEELRAAADLPPLNLIGKIGGYSMSPTLQDHDIRVAINAIDGVSESAEIAKGIADAFTQELQRQGLPERLTRDERDIAVGDAVIVRPVVLRPGQCEEMPDGLSARDDIRLPGKVTAIDDELGLVAVYIAAIAGSVWMKRESVHPAGWSAFDGIDRSTEPPQLAAAGGDVQVPEAVTPGSAAGGDPGVRPADPTTPAATTPAVAPADPEADLTRIRCELAREELAAEGVDVSVWTESDLVAHYDRVIRPREHGERRVRTIDCAAEMPMLMRDPFGGKAGR